MPGGGVNRHGMPLIVSVLGAGFIAGLIPAGILPANVLEIERTYDLSHAEMGRIVGLCMILGGATGGLLGGWTCGRIGALRNLLASFVLVAAALGAIGVVRTLTGTVLGLGGYFFAIGFMGSSNALAAHMLPDRQRGVNLLHALNATGKLAGPVLASLFIYGAWRNSFVAAAALPVLLMVPALMAYAGKDSRLIGRKRKEDGRASAAFWLAVSGFALIAGSEIAVALWLPAYAQKARGFSQVQANLLLSVFLTGMIAGRFASSALSKKLSSKRAMALCGVSALFALPAVASPAYVTASAFFFLFGLAFSAMWPSYFAYLSEVFPQHLGLMGGAAVFTTQIGFALCSYASGQLAELHLSYPILFGAAVVGAFALIFFALPFSRRPKGALQ